MDLDVYIIYKYFIYPPTFKAKIRAKYITMVK